MIPVFTIIFSGTPGTVSIMLMIPLSAQYTANIIKVVSFHSLLIATIKMGRKYATTVNTDITKYN
jgi:hypothetical protein